MPMAEMKVTYCLQAVTILPFILLLLSSASSQEVTECSSSNVAFPRLKFVSQLNVSGCTLLVHAHEASDGQHVTVEPAMCVLTERLDRELPRYDLITEQTYLSVPVMLGDDAMLSEVKRQLSHLSPKSVKFATVSEVSVSTDPWSAFAAFDFVWSPGESIGFLRLGCQPGISNCSVCNLASRLRGAQFEALDRVSLAATLAVNDTRRQIRYRLLMQNQINVRYSDLEWYQCLPKCGQLRQVRTLIIGKCSVPVHQRQDKKGHYLIEPVFCHNFSSLNSEVIQHDYSRSTHAYYLKLDVILKDDVVLTAVTRQLSDLGPLSVAFMQLRRAQSRVASALSQRFLVGSLMTSADWRSAQVRVHCRDEAECRSLRKIIAANPLDFWRQIKWSITSVIADDSCVHESSVPRFAWRMTEAATGSFGVSKCSILWTRLCLLGQPCKYFRTSDDRSFVVIQQRLTGSVSFQRNWADYERGFGDESDFWIGLSSIHALTSGGANLRVEMTLQNGTELHVEYAGFKVGGASVNYRMTYQEMVKSMSSVSLQQFDAMAMSKGMQFSTMDRDNDLAGESCSSAYGGGWWFNDCQRCNPNALFPSAACRGIDGSSGSTRLCMYWRSADSDVSGWLTLGQVRLMLQV